MQGSFGGETFTFSLFLVLCNRLTTMTVALCMLLVRRPAAAPRPRIHSARPPPLPTTSKSRTHC